MQLRGNSVSNLLYMKTFIPRFIGWFRRHLYRLADNLFADYRSAIVMFHHVTNEKLDDVHPSCMCTIDEFREIVADVKDSAISMDELVDRIECKKYAGRAIVLTFDDVPKDFYYNAYPILKESRVPFVLYITYNYIGLDGYLTKEQLQEIAADELATIASHTMTHPFLRGEKLAFIKREIYDSKDKLERMLNTSIRHFAYPYGSAYAVGYRAERELSKSTYRSAVATIAGYINPLSAKNIYRLPRIYSGLYTSVYK